MLLALDVGNTNTVLGLYPFRGPDAVAPDLTASWRVTTHLTQTADEYGVLFLNLFAMHRIDVKEVEAIIISSVVPPIDSTLRRVCERYFNLKPIFIEPGIKTGMPIHIDDPATLGADRLVNAVGAFAKYGGPIIIVDFGTATTFDIVTAQGEYVGGAIAAGLGISADALFTRAAKLSRVDIKKPQKVIGTSTTGYMQSGLYYGYIGLVDGILERLIAELPGARDNEPKVVATGGLARLILDDSKHIEIVDDTLTLDGLRMIFERNRTQKSREAVRKHS